MSACGPSFFVDRFRLVVQRFGDRPAIVTDGATDLTYDQLLRRSEEIAWLLLDRGIRKGDHVSLAMPKCPDLIASILACWQIGAVWTPVSPELPDARIAWLVSNSQSECILVLPRDRHRFSGFGSKANVSFGCLSIEQCPSGDHLSRLLPIQLHASDPAYLIYTSGSSGAAKGVLVSHRSIVSMLQQQIKTIGLDENSRSLFLLSPSFDAAISDLGTCLLAGASLHLSAELQKGMQLTARPDQLLDWIGKHEITYVDMPPVLLAKLDARRVPECLKAVLIGGEVCPQEVVKQWAGRVRLVIAYGPTEATVCTSMQICNPSEYVDASIGIPLDGVAYSIAQGDDSGELLIAGDCLALEYYGEPELTSEKFVQIGSTRYYRTGDRVRRANGETWIFEGRIDRQLKIRGHRIEPGEIEHGLVELREVQRAAVVARTSRLGRESLFAFVELSREGRQKMVEEEDLLSALALQFPKVMVPQRVLIVDELPETVTGKIDFGKLARCELPQPPGRQNTNDGNRLAWCVAKVLNARSIDPERSFVQLGGDSVSAIEVSAELQTYDFQVSPSILLADRSLAELWKQLQSDGSASAAALSAEFLRQDACSISDGFLKQAHTRQGRTGRKLANRRLASVLLTGATGFLGPHILKQLLCCGSEIFCLVRGGHEVGQRVSRRLAELRIDVSSSELSRLHIVEGDLTQQQCGLDDRALTNLRQRITDVIHCAGQTSVVASYHDLREANVVAPTKLATLFGSVARIHAISTLSVFVGTDKSAGRMMEHNQLDKTGHIYGGYAQSKWASELALRYLVKRLAWEDRIGFFRPSLLTASLSGSAAPENDLLTRAVRGCVALGCVPRIPARARINLLPVDFAAQLIVDIAREGVAGTYHIAHPQGVTAGELIGRLCDEEGLEELSPEDFTQRVNANLGDPLVASACLSMCRCFGERAVYDMHRGMDLFQSTDATFDMTETRRIAGALIDNAPSLDARFLSGLISQIVRPSHNEAVEAI